MHARGRVRSERSRTFSVVDLVAIGRHGAHKRAEIHAAHEPAGEPNLERVDRAAVRPPAEESREGRREGR